MPEDNSPHAPDTLKCDGVAGTEPADAEVSNTMRCIFCLEARPSTLEHIFPLAIGGRLTIDRLCRECNSMLGSRVDAALSDFFPIRLHRAKLGLAGNGGEVPSPYELFLGVATVIGEDVNRVHTTFNKSTGKLDLKVIPNTTEITMPDGIKQLRVTMDARDLDKIPRVIQRERRHRGLAPLSEEELAIEASKYTVTSVDQPLVQVAGTINFGFLRHAMMKIAYELAFMWLGEAYLDDPMAAILRTAICSEDVHSTDHLRAFVGFTDAEEFTIFRAWEPREAHHLAYAVYVPQANNIAIAIRVFDLYGAMIIVSEEPARYLQSKADAAKLRFVAIDSVTGKTIDTPFDVEQTRIVDNVRLLGRLPPFPDPLSGEC